MKYENFNQIVKLVDQIQKHQRKLDELNCDPEVHIVLPSSGRIYTIGVDKRFEHEYQPMANQLVEYIKADLQSRINNLMSQLELL